MKRIVLTTLLVLIVILFSASSFGAIQKDFTVTCQKDKSSITLTASNQEIGSGSNSALFKCVRNTHISGQCSSETTTLKADCTPKTTTSTPKDPCEPFKSASFIIQTETQRFTVTSGSTIEIPSSSQQGYLIVSGINLENGVDLYYDNVNVGNENPGGNAVGGMFSQFLTFTAGSHTIAAGTNKNPCPPQISFIIKQQSMITTTRVSTAICGNENIESGEVCDGTTGCATNYECASDCKSCKPKALTVSQTTPVYAIPYCSTYTCPSGYTTKSGASSIQQGSDPLNKCCDKTTSPCPLYNDRDGPELSSQCDSSRANFALGTPLSDGRWCCYFYKGPLTCPSYQRLVGNRCVYITATSSCGNGIINSGEECDSKSPTNTCGGARCLSDCTCETEYSAPSGTYYTTSGGSSSSGPKYSTAAAVSNLFTGKSIFNILKPKSINSITGKLVESTASPSISVKVENSQYICFVNAGSMIKTVTNDCGKDYCTLEGCKKTYSITTEKCGNSQKDIGEDCDFRLGTLGCKEGQICTQQCKCSSPMMIAPCGNGKQDSGEECGEPGLRCLQGTCEKCHCVVDGCTPSDDCRTNNDCVKKHKSGYYCEGCECRAPEIDEGCQVPPDECASDKDCENGKGLCQNCHCYVETPKEDCYENGGDECSKDEDCGLGGKCSGMPDCKCEKKECKIPPDECIPGFDGNKACADKYKDATYYCEMNCKCMHGEGESYCEECPDPLYFKKPATEGYKCDLADPTVPSVALPPLPPSKLFGAGDEASDNDISIGAGSRGLEPVDLEENPELKAKELELKELEENLAKSISDSEPLLKELNDLIEKINNDLLENKELAVDKIDEVIASFEKVKKLYNEYSAKLEEFLTKALSLNAVTEENKATLLEKTNNEIKSVEDQLKNLYNLKFQIEKALILEEKYEFISELQEEYKKNIELYNAKSSQLEQQSQDSMTGNVAKSFSRVTGMTQKIEKYSRQRISSEGEVTEQDVNVLENNVKSIISAIDNLIATYDGLKDIVKAIYNNDKISKEDYDKNIDDLDKETDDSKENKKSIKKLLDKQEFDSARLFIRLQAALAANDYIEAKKALDSLQLMDAIKDETAQEYHRHIDAEQKRVLLLSEVEEIRSNIPSANLLTTEIIFPRELVEEDQCNDEVDNDGDNAIDSNDAACQTGQDEVIDTKDVINLLYTLDPEFSLAFALLLTQKEKELISQRIQDLLYKDDEERNLDLFARALTNPTIPKREVRIDESIPISVQDYAQPNLCTATGGKEWYPKCKIGGLCLPFCSCPTGAFIEGIGCVNNPESYGVQTYVVTDHASPQNSVTGNIVNALFTKSKTSTKNTRSNKITGKAAGTGIPGGTDAPEIPPHNLLSNIYDNLKIEEENRKCRDIGESLRQNLNKVKLICIEMTGIIDGIKKALDDIDELRKGLDKIAEDFENSYKDTLDLFHKSQSGDGSTAGDDDDDATREAYNDYKDEEKAFDKVQEEYGLNGVDPDIGFSSADLNDLKKGKPRNERGRNDQKYIDRVAKDIGKNIQDLTIEEVQQHLDNLARFRNIARDRYNKISTESTRNTLSEDSITKDDYKNRAKNRVKNMNGDQIVKKAYDYVKKLQSAVDNAKEAAENAREAADKAKKIKCPESAEALKDLEDVANKAEKAAEMAAQKLENAQKAAQDAGIMWDVILSTTSTTSVSGIAGVSEEELEGQRENIFSLSGDGTPEHPTIEKLAAKALEAIDSSVQGKVYAEQAKINGLKANLALIRALIESLNCVKCDEYIPLGPPFTSGGCTPCKKPMNYLFPTQILAPEDPTGGTKTSMDPIPPPKPPSPSAQVATDLANAEDNLNTQKENERNIGTRIDELDDKEKTEGLTDEETAERTDLKAARERTTARTTELKNKIKNIKQPCPKEKVDEIQNNIKKTEEELENTRKEASKTLNDCKKEKTKAIEENAKKASEERSAEARKNLDSIVDKLRNKNALKKELEEIGDDESREKEAYKDYKDPSLQLQKINKGMTLGEANLASSLEQSGVDIDSGSLADAQNAAWDKLKEQMIDEAIKDKVNAEKGNVDQECREKTREFDEKIVPLEKQLSGLYEQLDDCTPKVRTEATKDFKGARETIYDKYKAKVDEYNALVEKATKTAEDLARINQLKNEIDWLRKELEKRQTPEDKAINQIVDTKNQVAALEARKNDLEDEITRQEKQKATTTDAEKAQEIQNSIDKLKEKLAEVTKELDSKNTHLSDLENSTSTTQQLAATKRHYEEQEARTKSERESLVSLRDKLQEELKDKKEGTVEYDKIKSDIEIIDQEIKKLDLKLLDIRKLKEQAEYNLTKVAGESTIGPPPPLDISGLMKGVEGKYLTSKDLAKINEVLSRIKQSYDSGNPISSIKNYLDAEMRNIEKVGDQYKITSVAQLIILNLYNAWIKAANKDSQQTFDYLQTLAGYFFDPENPEASATKIEEMIRKVRPMLNEEVVVKFLDQIRNFKDKVQDQKQRGVCAS